MRRQSAMQRDGSDGRLGERLLQRHHDMDGRPAEHHAAVHGHVEPLAGRARVGGRGRADVDATNWSARSRTSGRPTTDSGQEVKSALDTLSTTLDAETAQIQETAQGVTGVTDLPSAITKISASLTALGTAFSDTLQTIENADTKGELQTALEDSPDCADISS